MWRRGVLFVELPDAFVPDSLRLLEVDVAIVRTRACTCACVPLQYQNQLPTLFENKRTFKLLERIDNHGTEVYAFANKVVS